MKPNIAIDDIDELELDLESDLSDYLSTRQIMERFGWTTRAMVSQIARREGWQRKPLSRPRQYLASDVDAYAVSREHTRRTYPDQFNRHLIRHINGYSDQCPVCKNGT